MSNCMYRPNLWNNLQFHNIGYPADVPSIHSDKQVISLYNLNFTMTVVYLTDVWGFSTSSKEQFYSKVSLQSHVSIRLTMKISKTSICCRLSAKNRYSDFNHWAHTVNAICRESALDNLRPWCVLHLIRRIISPKNTETQKQLRR